MVDSTTLMLRSWESKVESEGGMALFRIDQDLRSLSADIISRSSFGSNYSKGKEIFLKLRTLQKIMSQGNIGIPGLRYKHYKKSHLYHCAVSLNHHKYRCPGVLTFLKSCYWYHISHTGSTSLMSIFFHSVCAIVSCHWVKRTGSVHLNILSCSTCIHTSSLYVCTLIPRSLASF